MYAGTVAWQICITICCFIVYLYDRAEKKKIHHANKISSFIQLMSWNHYLDHKYIILLKYWSAYRVNFSWFHRTEPYSAKRVKANYRKDRVKIWQHWKNFSKKYIDIVPPSFEKETPYIMWQWGREKDWKSISETALSIHKQPLKNSWFILIFPSCRSNSSNSG